MLEGVADDALDAFAGVDVFLSGDFVGSSLFEEAAGTDVDAFGVFAKDDEANVVADAIFEWSEALVEKLGGAGVHEKIEFEAQAEEDISGMLIGGDARIAESAEEDGVEFVLEHFDGTFRERDFFAEIFVGGPVEFDEFDAAVMFRGGGLDGSNADGSDFFADAVAGNDGDAGVGTAGAERGGGHGKKVA